jgi:hypothetical protein
MSTLKADTIVASDGTSPVTLTKQDAVKSHYGYNIQSSTQFGVSSGSGSNQSLNISSYTDSGTGRLDVYLSNAHSNTQYNYVGGVRSGNNTNTIDPDLSTTSRIRNVLKDADSNTDSDIYSYCYTIGDLA